MCVPYVHILECKKDKDSTLLGNGRLGKQALEIARYDEENECRFEVQREKHCMPRDLRGLQLSGKCCWSYFVTKSLMIQ